MRATPLHLHAFFSRCLQLLRTRGTWLLFASVVVGLLPWSVVVVIALLSHLRTTHWEMLLPFLAADVWFGVSSSVGIPLYTLIGAAGIVLGEWLRPYLLL